MSEVLPIIDWNQHAQASTGNLDMSKELLILFMQQLPELEDKLQTAFVGQNGEEIHAVLHRLQGACAYCGLPRLRSVIATAAKAHKMTEQFTSDQHAAILREIDVVKSELINHKVI